MNPSEHKPISDDLVHDIDRHYYFEFSVEGEGPWCEAALHDLEPSVGYIDNIVSTEALQRIMPKVDELISEGFENVKKFKQYFETYMCKYQNPKYIGLFIC